MSHFPSLGQPSGPPEWDMILSASQKNNADEVLRLIDEVGVPPSHCNVVGQTSLHIAALWGCVEALEVLINAGANVNAQNQIAKTTPLQCAVKGTFQSFQETHSRRLRCVKLLLQAGADGAIRDMRGKDAFECVDDAIQESYVRQMGGVEEEMEEMRRALASGGGAAGLKLSPLAEFIEGLDSNGVRDFLGSGGDEDGMEMAKGILSAVEMFKVLVEEMSDDRSAYDALRDIINCLLEAGVNPNSFPLASNAASPMSEAPLHIISSSVCTAYARAPKSELIGADAAADIVRSLLAHGAKVGSTTMALLPSSAHRGGIEPVKFLTKIAGVDPNYRGRQGMSSLVLASRSGKIDIVKLLLEDERVDVTIGDDAGKTAIDYAKANGKDEIVEMLLKQS